MTAPDRRGFTRLETDEELLERIKLKTPYGKLGSETVDEFAERFGLERRIVEGTP